MIRKLKQGFTIVELMLAMTFVSVLLLAIALTSIQAGKLYNRGVTLRNVNQSGRNISDMLRRDFLQSNAQKIAKDGSHHLIQVKTTDGTVVNERICLGYYSYIWNRADAMVRATGDNAIWQLLVKYDDVGTRDAKVNLLRVVDSGGNLCRKSGSPGAYPNVVDRDISTELLQSPTDENFLGMYNSYLKKITSGDGSEALFALGFTLGTGRTGEISTADQSCKPPADDDSNVEFCAINKFETIVRTNG